MKNYKVIIHYGGSWKVEVQARSDEEAREKACDIFANETDIETIWNNVDWDVCDSWKIEED